MSELNGWRTGSWGRPRPGMVGRWGWLWLAGLLLLVACQSSPDLPADGPLLVPTVVIDMGEPVVDPNLPPTWTPGAAAVAVLPAGGPYPTFTPRPSATTPFFPSRTPIPSRTPVPGPENTPVPTPTNAPTASVTPPAPAPGAANLLPNPSFEEGWYHIGGIPELQVADQWRLEWDEGSNSLDPDPWNAWVRPEARVLSSDFLPPSEHNLFIWDGEQTVKIFKGRGAVSFRLLTDVALEPGTYIFTINVFPDLVDGYTASGQKIWAPDPLSGEVRFIIGSATTDWVLPSFGRKNTLTHAFQLETAQTLRLGVAIRGRWAIENNGWFMDDWSLVRAADGS